VDVTYWKCKQGSSLGFIPIGRPVANTQIYILDEDLKPVPLGEVGELHIGGVQVARGYINRPELTEEKFIEDPFREESGARLYKTGDLASFLPTGDVKFLGRIDHQVKIGGNRIELGEIETVLGLHPSINQVVVLAREDVPGEKRLVAYLVAAPEQKIDIQKLRQYLVEKLPDYMIPSVFMPIETMPLSPNGKIDRGKLPKPDNIRPEFAHAFVPARNKLETYLVSLWCEILSLDRVGIHDRFFELGGTSLQAARFINILQEDFNENIYIVSVFEKPTIAEYAEFLLQDYILSLQKKFGTDIVGKDAHKHDIPKVSQGTITEDHVAQMREIIIPLPESEQVEKSPKNPAALFILAPPRSGTTLLRVMLSGHPDLFAASELQLLSFNTLRERTSAYSGKYKLWLEGTIRMIMELRNCNAEEAMKLMDEYEEKDYSTKMFYAVLQNWIGKKILVDKSPSYALDINTLQKAERDFNQARFIHIVRHPYAMVNSFTNYHMDQVLYLKKQPFSPKQLAELVWLVSHKNIMDFFETIPKDRQCNLRFEDLVTEPQITMEKLCDALQIQFHPSLIKPYDRLEEKMTNGIFDESKPMGDTHFLEHRKINPKVADSWKGVQNDDFLSDMTWDLAEALGYERPDSRKADLLRSSTQEKRLSSRTRNMRFEVLRSRRSHRKNDNDR